MQIPSASRYMIGGLHVEFFLLNPMNAIKVGDQSGTGVTHSTSKCTMARCVKHCIRFGLYFLPLLTCLIVFCAWGVV